LTVYSLLHNNTLVLRYSYLTVNFHRQNHKKCNDTNKLIQHQE